MDAKSLKHLFDSYENQSEFHQASDGEVFLTKGAAEAYAARLDDKEIKTLTKDMAVETKAPKTPETKTAANKVAPVAKGSAAKKVKADTKDIVTKDDLETNPDLENGGEKEGDEIE
jgi:hypothetical protein